LLSGKNKRSWPSQGGKQDFAQNCRRSTFLSFSEVAARINIHLK
jgi:hypothetical protein